MIRNQRQLKNRNTYGPPPAQGLYDPANEKDSCGVGFIAHIKGRASHAIMEDALVMLHRMDHRGACGCEANTGDGAGILTALPHDYLCKVVARDVGIQLPEASRYGVGMSFLPKDESARSECKAIVEQVVNEQGQQVLGWRLVPTDAEGAGVGPTALSAEPAIEQVFVAAADDLEQEAFERELYVIRKRAFHMIKGRSSARPQLQAYYICSFSSKIIIYKGQLTSGQVPRYYPDLRDPDYVSHLAMVHSRFSTNTFPSWNRAQPMRWMCHNGEIDTLRGNVNWIRAREGLMRSDLFGQDLKKVMPVIDPSSSDSGIFDNVLEILMLAGRTPQEAVMMMIPEAWENHETMSPDKRAFYEYHANLMEPWDGPASIAFTDGKYIGAVLDRNGLRPSRYYVTDDDRVIMASEVGVLPVPAESVVQKGRLQPGRMFLVNFEEGRIVPDQELKQSSAGDRPYGTWLQKQRIELSDLSPSQNPHGFEPDTLLRRMQAFGYTTETLQFILKPLIEVKKDPIGSMGNDASLACLSDHPRMLYDYFKQLFAQVTNPAIDSIREEIIMSLECQIGPEGNLLETTEKQCHRLLVPHPILDNEQLAAIKCMDHRGWKARTIDITYDKQDAKKRGGTALIDAIEQICKEASNAIAMGYQLVVLSDRNIAADRIAVSMLLATGSVHQHLVRETKRTRIGIVVETGEAREVHHHCLLVGYGADAINPYLAFESLWQCRVDGLLEDNKNWTDGQIVKAYRKGVAKGMLKVMAKMGISTLASYKGAQIFEALGLGEEVVNRCFTGTPCRIKGVDFDVLANESLRCHEIGYPTRSHVRLPILPNDGQIHWRADGERHAWSPQTVSDLQVAARTNNSDAYWKFAEAADTNARTTCTLRGLFQFKSDPDHAIDLDEVESAKEIVKRFCTGAMSFGSISEEAHTSLAIALNQIGGKSNTGEGGEDPERYIPLPDGSMNPRRSAIKQVASGRFGVTINYLTNADELQIKIAQGAKPGEGGELPGHKVDDYIARIRHSTPGVGLISPPPHHDIYSIEDLKQLIHDLKNANPRARVSVKLVSEVGVGTIAAGVAKGYADHILISGDVGGTGASPLTSVKHAGLPWELGIAETHQTLVLNDLRSRVVLQTDGGIKTGRDVVIAAILGAEEMGFATAPLITLGCIMMRKCHLNTCPVGVATQDPDLRKKFTGKPEHVVNYLFMVAEQARKIMADLGVRTINELIGRTELLEPREAINHWKAHNLDLTPVLMPANKMRPEVGVYCQISQDHGLDAAMDNKIIELAQPAIQNGLKVEMELPITNINRTVGTMLSHEIAKKWGEDLLPEGTVKIKLSGSAGQSLAAFLARGIDMELEGDANDYVGKGLSGGNLAIYPPKESAFVPHENIIIGNVALYGATEGSAFFRGAAAERFCVRNSGAKAVIEGVGDHGCEYMTGGRVVILGPTGRNFAAGMSGGIAYIYDPEEKFLINCNLATVELEKMTQQADIEELRDLIDRHVRATRSTVGQGILSNWKQCFPKFVKVMPIDYKRFLRERMAQDTEKGDVLNHTKKISRKDYVARND